MPNLPIRYAQELPPGTSPAVRSNVDLRTGAEQVGAAVGAGAAAGQAVAQAGGQLAQVGANLLQKITDAEDAMALSTLQRQNGEGRERALAEAQATQDPALQEKILSESRKNLSTMPTGVRPRVARAYQQYLDRQAPGLDAQDRQIVLKTRITRAKDQHEINSQAQIEKGDFAEYVKTQVLAEKMGIITPEQATENVGTFVVRSNLTQINKAIFSGDPGQIQQGLERLADLPWEELPEAQAGDAAGMRTRAQSLINGIQSENYQNAFGFIEPVVTAGDQPQKFYAAVEAATKEFADAEESGRINSHQANTLRRAVRAEVDRFEGGRKATRDIKTEVIGWDMVFRINWGSTPKEVGDVKRWILEHLDSLGAKAPELLKALNRQQKEEDSNLADVIALQDAQSPITDKSDFMRMLAVKKAWWGKLGGSDLLKYVAEEQVLWEAARGREAADKKAASLTEYQRPLEAVSPAKTASVLGEARAGGYVDRGPFGMGKATFMPYTGAEVIRRFLETWGENWKQVPEAVEIVNRKWPGAIEDFEWNAKVEERAAEYMRYYAGRDWAQGKSEEELKVIARQTAEDEILRPKSGGQAPGKPAAASSAAGTGTLPPGSFKVGTMVYQQGKAYRVTGYTEDGKLRTEPVVEGQP